MQPLILENDRILLRLAPGLGRIEELVDKKTAKDWVWQPKNLVRTDAREFTLEACFDEHWQGGWEEIFPNDAPCSLNGYSLVDHGELWRRPWDVQERQADRVHLRFQCRTIPAMCDKSIALSDASLTFAYKITNTSDCDWPYMFKLHWAMRIEEGDRFLLPRCEVEPVDPSFGSFLKIPGRLTYPDGVWSHDSDLDRCLSADSNTREFFYASNLGEGRCGIRDKSGDALVLEFSKSQFPYAWLFQSFGGFRGHYMAILEPASTMPYDIIEAAKRRTCPVIQAHSSAHYTVTVTLQTQIH